uniref:Uncharacterized protein n=1 Tax=Timema genevievae TaxID=629358 RepID=A0A7R9PH06_TIMGE|nr:unnamed protein product [Timema genevievae]
MFWIQGWSKIKGRVLRSKRKDLLLILWCRIVLLEFGTGAVALRFSLVVSMCVAIRPRPRLRMTGLLLGALLAVPTLSGPVQVEENVREKKQ